VVIVKDAPGAQGEGNQANNRDSNNKVNKASNKDSSLKASNSSARADLPRSPRSNKKGNGNFKKTNYYQYFFLCAKYVYL
jgi:hypothetical protein